MQKINYAFKIRPFDFYISQLSYNKKLLKN